MKIAIDITASAWTGKRSGVGHYISALTNNLADIDSNNEYLLYAYFSRDFEQRRKSLFIPQKENFRLKVRRIPIQVFNFLAVNVPLNLLSERVDVIHSPFYVPPHPRKIRTILTIHDLTSILFPQFHTKYVRRLGVEIRRSCRRIDKVIAVSENTKGDVVNLFGIPEEKVVVTHEAADEIFKPLKDAAKIASIKAKYKIPNEFVLFVGTLEPRKNIIALIKAFSLMKDKIEHKLVVVGKKGWLYTEIFEQVAKLGVEDRVVFTGYVPDEDLVWIYNACDVFVYPSVYEGFGLPVIEAMACGAPVITSNTSSLPEVAGNAAILVNPQNIDEISTNIMKVLEDDNLKKQLSQKGIEQAKKFSWKKTAEKTLAAYMSLA